MTYRLAKKIMREKFKRNCEILLVFIFGWLSMIRIQNNQIDMVMWIYMALSVLSFVLAYDKESYMKRLGFIEKCFFWHPDDRA